MQELFAMREGLSPQNLSDREIREGGGRDYAIHLAVKYKYDDDVLQHNNCVYTSSLIALTLRVIARGRHGGLMGQDEFHRRDRDIAK